MTEDVVASGYSIVASAMAHSAKQAAHFRHQRDLKEIEIKSEQAAMEDALALHVAANASEDELKRWSSASTPASARKAIEQSVLQRAPFTWHVDVNELRIDMAGLSFQYDQAKADYERFAAEAWHEVADLLNRGKVRLMASVVSREMPVSIPSIFANSVVVTGEQQ